ncbi:hypothetical protein CP533_1647 [Ophiocordyceps camponoti-saundersi (nom. inval.)]|nr:hypothetical protein CP533_1647 [Ophiocordyceps camponoti-saundersi (nom. inval.)]
MSRSPAATGQQPTYTTAGTIYNPNAALPLQPPARRGRANRFQTGHNHWDQPLGKTIPYFHNILPSFGPFPKLLPGQLLPSHQAVYTPLQQNYDRAVSPVVDSDHPAFEMTLGMPHALPEKAPAALSFLLADKDDGDKAMDDEQFAAAEDDMQDQLRMQSLKKMPIKSVNNLASYPNPTQRAARMALREGGGPSFVSGDDAPMGLLRPGDFMDTDPAGPPPRLLPTARDADGSTPTTLANGPGAPMPLTAGPPGQRQYRPSTFESTFRALQPSRPQPVQAETGEYDSLAALVRASEPDPQPYRRYPPGSSAGSWARNKVGSFATDSSREERILEAWYAGTKYFGMTMEEILEESASRRGQHPHGAIGDGRLKKAKTEYAHIDMEKARNTPVPEDAAPLVRCLFASLLRLDDNQALRSSFTQGKQRSMTTAEGEGSKSACAGTSPTAEDEKRDEN